MKKDKNLNILVITRAAWVETSAFGNTLSNFFGDWPNTRFVNIYCRQELPQNDICDSYYNITESQLIKQLFTPKEIGRKFSQSDIRTARSSNKVLTNIQKEKRLLDFFRKNRATFFLFMRELIWGSGGWKNKKLDEFLAENAIDIIFAAAADTIYLQKIVRYCQDKTEAKLVLFFADDIYSYQSYSPLKYIYKKVLRKNIKASVNSAAKLYGASEKLCHEYEQVFEKPIELLYKGCVFEECAVKETVSTTIKIVYAGNLFYGRWEILKAIADELEEINVGSIKMTLEIYTTATITPELDAALNRGRSSFIRGSLPYEGVKEVLANADIVLHVESFAQEQIKATRLSFSTKIIDCMQSGSCMMAIGPDELASIQYLKRAEGTMVINDLNQIGKVLEEIAAKPDSIIQNARALNSFAHRYHNIGNVKNKLQEGFKNLLGDIEA